MRILGADQTDAGNVVPNLYILEWQGAKPNTYQPARERVLSLGEGRSIRLKAIEATNFGWVFSAFGSNQPLNAVSPKVLRALLHRSYDLVRHDIPRKTVHADFEMLERAVKSDSSFAKLFGITTVSSPSSNTVDFPHTLSDLAEKAFGEEGAHWTKVQPYLDRVYKETGANIKHSDNRYHSATKAGKKSVVHKYSDHLLDVIIKMIKEQPYCLEL